MSRTCWRRFDTLSLCSTLSSLAHTPALLSIPLLASTRWSSKSPQRDTAQVLSLSLSANSRNREDTCWSLLTAATSAAQQAQAAAIHTPEISAARARQRSRMRSCAPCVTAEASTWTLRGWRRASGAISSSFRAGALFSFSLHRRTRESRRRACVLVVAIFFSLSLSSAISTTPLVFFAAHTLRARRDGGAAGSERVGGVARGLMAPKKGKGKKKSCCSVLFSLPRGLIASLAPSASSVAPIFFLP